MEIALITSAWRFLVAVSGLAVFSALEVFWQFKDPIESKVRHYLRNLLLGLSNGLILHLTVGGLLVAYYDALAERGIGLMNFLHLGAWTNIVLSLVFLDFITYVWHRAYHEVPFLWRLHRVHHSDLDLDVTSASRFHISEVALSSGFKMLVGLVWGPSAIALAIHEAMLGLAAQFHHSNIRLPEPWESRLRKIVVTPHMHHIHHSNVISETNSNYSNFLSVWDRLLGTYVHFDDQERIVYGLESYTKLPDVSLKKLLVMPFDDPCRENADKVRSRRQAMKGRMKVNDEITIAGQPSKNELQEFSEEGFRSVINLRRHGEDGLPMTPEEEGEEVRALGMEYLHIPVSMDSLRLEVVDTFRKGLQEAPKPVLVHCGVGKRAGAFVMMDMGARRGMSGEETVRMAEGMGFDCGNKKLFNFAKSYIDSHKK